jgi:hypothetical protein
MSVSAEWYDQNQTMIVFSFSGNWQWDEFHRLFLEIKNQAEKLNHPVVYSYNFLEGGKLPVGVLDQGKKAFYEMATNASHEVVVIGANMLVEKMASIFLTVFGNRMGVKAHFVDTLPQGYEHVQHILKLA